MASVCALVWWILSFSAITIGHFRVAEAWAKPIGVCYGRVADDLPSAAEVIRMYKQHNIGKLRLYKPDADALNALRGSGIEVIVDVPNEDLPNIANGIGPAVDWVNTNLKPYYRDVAIKYVSAGNEVVPGEFSRHVAPAIGNLQSAILSYNMNILVTTAVEGSVLKASYPPSAGAFSDAARADMVSILKFLNRVQAPLIVHLYPYFSYAADPVNVRLDYAQFTAQGPVVFDGRFQYQNLLDAMADAFYSAMEREGFGGTRVIVGESGWPTAGNSNFTTVQLAETYNRNFVNKILSRTGTPKRPNTPLDGYVFAMFNEDNKAAGVEQHWGLFYPNKSPVYPIFK